jgi:hypothetical protein
VTRKLGADEEVRVWWSARKLVIPRRCVKALSRLDFAYLGS